MFKTLNIKLLVAGWCSYSFGKYEINFQIISTDWGHLSNHFSVYAWTWTSNWKLNTDGKMMTEFLVRV